MRRKGGNTVTIRLAPRTARAVDLAISERLEGPLFIGWNGKRMTRDAAARMDVRRRLHPRRHDPTGSHWSRSARKAGAP